MRTKREEKIIKQTGRIDVACWLLRVCPPLMCNGGSDLCCYVFVVFMVGYACVLVIIVVLWLVASVLF